MKLIKNCFSGFVGLLLLARNSDTPQLTKDGQRWFIPPSGSDAIRNSPFFLLHSPV